MQFRLRGIQNCLGGEISYDLLLLCIFCLCIWSDVSEHCNKRKLTVCPRVSVLHI
ncbi:hypothetical protein C5167_015508 [Papaver somniferum]|uniref:Uncharacterized protein n=1 Tax=Papaver somniferum TaxID=3469 RepID=A0A4Y7J866_PAPSO|nr:hypothetical protein C5167_015508 [Papaver somniferum]